MQPAAPGQEEVQIGGIAAVDTGETNIADMINEREQVVKELEQLEDIKESEMIDKVVADNEAGNAGVISVSVGQSAAAQANASGNGAADGSQPAALGAQKAADYSADGVESMEVAGSTTTASSMSAAQ